jgi:hypothetical protein
MPGYPLALISTDVFQEGEDLHTFCDSVMHYGLAPSPVGIEQKTGRVDRVGSLAQRRLLSLDLASHVTPEQLIQVSFPYVKESIEVLQVRQLCHNINAFIESLHEIGEPTVKASDIIDTVQALQDRSLIPEQIVTPLKSPYVPKVVNKSDTNNYRQLVNEQTKHARQVIQHIEKLLRQLFGEPVLGREGVMLAQPDGGNIQIDIQLKSARASGEMLLTASYQVNDLTLQGLDEEALDVMMRDMSWNTFHRTYVKETAKGAYVMYHDAEMMIGDEHTTTYSELEYFFQRFSDIHEPASYQKPTSAHIVRYWRNAEKQQLPQFGQWSITADAKEQAQCLVLTFIFSSKGSRRKHRVKIYESNGRCIFMAKAADYEKVAHFSLEQFIKYTWQRNALIDIVEFMFDESGDIMGRAVHPIEGMTFKEFFYCAYTLAVATDRLEYLIQEPDIH